MQNQRVQELRNSIVFLKSPKYSDKDVLAFSIKSALNNLKADGENSVELLKLFNSKDFDDLKEKLSDVDWLLEDIELYETL